MASTTLPQALRLGMIGGGTGAFIGAVHRMAFSLDQRMSLVAGCFSSSPHRAVESGRALGIAPERNYGTWEEMFEAESNLPLHTRIQAVVIVTPNHVHFAPALAFTRAGFHVICDKPLTTRTEDADALVAEVARAKTVFAVTYNYSGYPLVKQARHLVTSGELGEIRKVVVEYNQGWLANDLEASGQKQASWRTDPAQSGAGGAIGDIGSHAEQLLATITGQHITQICADLTSFVPGRRLDDDANVLLRLSGGGKGILTASQVQIGSENDLRIRVHGTKGSLRWAQEDPNSLTFHPASGPEQIFRRGNPGLCPAAAAATRLPPGHPEAFLEAFANIYAAAGRAIAAGAGGLSAPKDYDFPGVQDGARGVHFIQNVVASSKSDQKWHGLPAREGV
jgi:predicted dehydrogenase